MAVKGAHKVQRYQKDYDGWFRSSSLSAGGMMTVELGDELQILENAIVVLLLELRCKYIVLGVRVLREIEQHAA